MLWMTNVCTFYMPHPPLHSYKTLLIKIRSKRNFFNGHLTLMKIHWHCRWHQPKKKITNNNIQTVQNRTDVTADIHVNAVFYLDLQQYKGNCGNGEKKPLKPTTAITCLNLPIRIWFTLVLSSGPNLIGWNSISGPKSDWLKDYPWSRPDWLN